MSGRFLVEAFGTREVVRVVTSISAEHMVEGDWISAKRSWVQQGAVGRG